MLHQGDDYSYTGASNSTIWAISTTSFYHSTFDLRGVEVPPHFRCGYCTIRFPLSPMVLKSTVAKVLAKKSQDLLQKYFLFFAILNFLCRIIISQEHEQAIHMDLRISFSHPASVWAWSMAPLAIQLQSIYYIRIHVISVD